MLHRLVVAVLVCALLLLGLEGLPQGPGAVAEAGAQEAPEWAREASIYHVFVDRFRDGDRANNVDVDPTQSVDDALIDWMGGDLAGVREGLDHIEGLGFDTVWLSPTFEGAYSHGYHPIDFLEVDENFGTLAELRSLVEDVHGRGMRIVFDMVPNHTSDQHPWFQDALEHCQASVYYDWYRFNADCTDYDSFFGIAELPELNLDNPETRAYFLDEVVPFYLDAGYTHPETGEQGLGFDGFRLDYVLGPSLDFWADFRDAVATTDPDAFIFGEAWASRSTIAGYQDVFHGAVNFPLHDAFKAAIARGGSLSAIDQAVRLDAAAYGDGFLATTFLDNHDVSRFLWEAGQATDEPRAVARLVAALTTQFVLPDPPIVYYGTDVGMGQSGSGPHPEIGGWGDRWYREPMPWPDQGDEAWEHEWWQDEANRQTWRDDVAAHVTTLNAVRSAHEALVYGAYEVVVAGESLLAFERVHEGERVLVLAHTGGAPTDVSLAGLYGEAIPDGVTLDGLVAHDGAASADGDLTVGLEGTHAAVFAVDGDLPAAPGHQGPVDGPSAVSIAGDFQSAVGCDSDWDPACPATQLSWSDDDRAWEATFTIPAGSWHYKAVTERAWDRGTDFPAQDRRLDLAEETAVTFLVDHTTDYVLDTRNDEIVTAVGDFQAQLGCAGDWQPDCLRGWLQDPQRDGVYRRTLRLDAGEYETKAVVGRAWPPEGEDFPANNLRFDVPSDNTPVHFTFDRNTNEYAIEVGDVGDPPDADQPDQVVIAGSFQSELGCADDWQPGCTETGLHYSAGDRAWFRSFDLPAGDWEYKVTIDGSWDENYGANAERDGPNIALSLDQPTTVTFYYSHQTNWVTDDVNHRIVTAPGDYQSQVGCPERAANLGGNWEPACLRSWLQDIEGDGIYHFTTDALAAGSYEVKAAVGRSWAENYGAPGADGRGTPDGPNIPFTVPEDNAPITFRFVSETNALTVEGAEEVDVNLTQQRAYWVAREAIAWPVEVDDDHTYALHYAADAGIAVTDGALTGADETYELTPDDGALPADDIDRRFRHLRGMPGFRLAADGAERAETLLRGQVVVSATDADANLVAATGLQIPGVLDDLYAADATQVDLGLSWDAAGRPTVRLWAPTAQDVTFHRFTDSQPSDGDPLADAVASLPMARDDASGVWEVAGSSGWKWDYYVFEIDVYAPSTQQVETNIVTDPYSHSLAMDSVRSQLVDLRDRELKPAAWDRLRKPRFSGPEDAVVYELHVRDFSAHDESVPDEHAGTYMAFTHRDTHGMEHLRSLARAGLTHLHLLPSFDIATIPENPEHQIDPDMPDRNTIRNEDPASPEPQAIQQATRDQDPFNWGYDPWHFNVPEGSYATNPDGPRRIVEYREMVRALNRVGLRVVKDVVYNHTNAAEQHERSVFDRVVPGYYHRLDARGNVETSTCCPNTATEHALMEQFMVDSVVDWAVHYKVDGFRFDLMGHHSRDNMLAVREALDALTPARDGVDGGEIILYGEGWNFGEVADGARFDQATQAGMAGTEIATFNDRLRDAVRGGHPFAGLQEQGFATGLGTEPNAVHPGTPEEQQAQALHEATWIMLGLAGNLADYELVTPDGTRRPGSEIDYRGSPAGYADSPLDNVVYVSKHDNETLFDAIQLKAPAEASIAERVRMQNLALSVVGFSQGIPFFHAGSDLLRSKSLDRNSYNSGDWFNRVDWTRADNNWGVGLPPAAENAQDWDVHEDVLTSRPGAVREHIDANAAHFEEILRIRAGSGLFRMGAAADVKERVRFHHTGADQQPGLIVMELVGDGSRGVPGGFTDAVVVFNAAPAERTIDGAGIPARQWRLHPVQNSSSDPVVRGSSYDRRAHAFTVPGRTTAVFVASATPGRGPR